MSVKPRWLKRLNNCHNNYVDDTTSASLLALDIQRGRFLAEGGFGKVYEGWWSNNQVAIKVLEDVQLAAQEEFKNEVALMLPLKHPRIVQCYGLSS